MTILYNVIRYNVMLYKVIHYNVIPYNIIHYIVELEFANSILTFLIPILIILSVKIFCMYMYICRYIYMYMCMYYYFHCFSDC